MGKIKISDGDIMIKSTVCQLMTGSFRGKLESCNCLSMKQCKFSEEERKHLINTPEVVEAINRNQKEYNSRLCDEYHNHSS